MANLIPSYARIEDLTEANTFNDWKNKTNLTFRDLNTLASLQAPADLVVTTAFANSVINALGPAQIQENKLAVNAAISNIVDNTLSGLKLSAGSVPFAKLVQSDIHITNAMLNLSNNALDGAKIVDSSITGAKLATGQLDGNTLTRKSVYVNKMFATQENVLFGLGTISGGNWGTSQAEAAELLIGAGLASVTNAPFTGTPSDGDVRGGRIYWQPNIVRNISSIAVTATSNSAAFSTSYLTTGNSGHYLNADGGYTNGTVPTITGRTDYFLPTTINALNNSHILITVQIGGAVQSNYGNYGFKLYKIVNNRTTLVDVCGTDVFPYYTDNGTTRTTVATFNFIDASGVTGVTYPGTSPVIGTGQGANGTSAAGSPTSSNPIAAHNTYSTITYFVRHINSSNGGQFYLSLNVVSSMTLQEMPV